MSAIDIREATESDLSGILRAYNESGISGDRSFTLEEARVHFARLRILPGYRIFVALSEGELAGSYTLVILDKLAKRGARCGIVDDVAVLPQHQRKGVGRAMMDHAMALCRLADCYKLTLSSGLPREGAHRFYESLGFDRHGYSYVIAP